MALSKLGLLVYDEEAEEVDSYACDRGGRTAGGKADRGL